MNENGETRGQRLVKEMRGRATTSLSTEQLMDLLRGNDRSPASLPQSAVDTAVEPKS